MACCRNDRVCIRPEKEYNIDNIDNSLNRMVIPACPESKILLLLDSRRVPDNRDLRE